MTSLGGDDLTPAEARFVALRLRRLRAKPEGMVLGMFAEALVAEALPNCVETDGGTDRWDLQWKAPDGTGIKIEVKCSRTGSWAVAPSNMRENGVRVRRRRSDVYVLAAHHGEAHGENWEFYVVPTWRIDQHAKDSVARSRLLGWGTLPTAAEGLPEAVFAAAQSRPTF